MLFAHHVPTPLKPDPETPHPAVVATTAMADSSNSPAIVATPYPTYISPGGDDDSDETYKAALISHSAASVERNQDSQFAAARSQLVHRDVQSARRDTVEAKFDLVVAQKDGELRALERFSAIEKELAALRAEGLARDVSSLRAELGESRASARQDGLMSVLGQILAKLGSTP
jgi:hypothetical protein